MAATTELKLVIITPERRVLEERAASVVIPAHDGELGILHQRAPLMCELGIGQLRYTRDRGTRRVFINGGFAQVFDDQVTVLTTEAVPAEQVTAEAVQAAERAAGEVPPDAADAAEIRRRAQQRVRALRQIASRR